MVRGVEGDWPGWVKKVAPWMAFMLILVGVTGVAASGYMATRASDESRVHRNSIGKGMGGHEDSRTRQLGRVSPEWSSLPRSAARRADLQALASTEVM